MLFSNYKTSFVEKEYAHSCPPDNMEQFIAIRNYIVDYFLKLLNCPEIVWHNDEFLRAWQEAVIFHENVLGLKVSMDLDVMQLSTETEALAVLDNNLLDTNSSIVFIALFKITLLILYVKSRKYEDVDMHLLYFVGKIFHELHFDTLGPDTYRIYIELDSMEVGLKKRVKETQRGIVKLLNNMDEIEDVVGLRILVSNPSDVLKITRYLIDVVFNENGQVYGLKMFNLGFLNEDMLERLTFGNTDTPLETYVNPSSAEDDFQAFFITGVFRDVTGRELPFEIQFNQNGIDLDKGMAHHDIYELKQRFGAVINCYGYITERYLNESIKNVAITSGRGIDQIRDHILSELLVEIGTNEDNERLFTSKTMLKQI